MSRFLIAYDLHGEDRDDDFHTIETRLEVLGAIAVQLSVWYYAADLSAEEIEQELVPPMNPLRDGDSLIIAPVADPTRWGGFNWDTDS
jgi:hypothetical protein